MIGFSTSSETTIAATQIDAEIAIRCRITTGISTITSMPSASVMMPESVGSNSSANAATIACVLFQLWRWYSS